MELEVDLALEGGGARVFGHLVLLELLDTHSIEVRNVAGTSAGAVAATLFFMGFRARHVAAFFDQEDVRKKYNALLSQGGRTREPEDQERTPSESNIVLCRALQALFDAAILRFWNMLRNWSNGIVNWFSRAPAFLRSTNFLWNAMRGNPVLKPTEANSRGLKEGDFQPASVVEEILGDLLEFGYAEGIVKDPKSIPSKRKGDRNSANVFILATDLVERRGVTFKPGSKISALRAMSASAQIPLVFSSWKTDPSKLRNFEPAQHIVDGGMFANLPVHVLEGLAEEEAKRHLARFGVRPKPIPIVAAFFNPSSIEEGVKHGKFRDLMVYLRVLLDTMISSTTRIVDQKGAQNIYTLGIETDPIGTLDFGQMVEVIRSFGTEGSIYQKTRERLEEDLLKLKNEIADTQSLAVQEISSASAANVSLRSGANRVTRIGEEIEKLAVVKVPYTDINEGLMGFQNKVSALIASEFSETYAIPIEVSRETHDPSRFDAIERPELAIAEETLYTFPFFLSYLRRHAWGVIPYAKHRSIGLIHANSYDDDKSIKQMLEEQEKAAAEKKWDRVQNLTKKTLDQLMVLGANSSKSLYVEKGSIQKEFVPLLIRACGNETMQAVYAKSITQVDEGFFRRLERPDYADNLVLEDQPTELLSSGKAAFLIDLADEHLYRKALKDKRVNVDELAFSKLHHGLEIPVGVGFSLPLIERLIKTSPQTKAEVWRSIQDIAETELEDSRSHLRQSGIELLSH